MASEIVLLTSDSDEDDVHFCGESPGKGLGETNKKKVSNSDEELMNLDLDSPTRPTLYYKRNIDFEIIAVEPREHVTEDNNYTEPDYPRAYSESPIPTYSRAMSPVTEPLTKITNPPAKKTTKSKQDKAYEKACKAAEAANKKFNRASDCLKYVTTLVDSRILDAIPSSGNILTQLQEAEMKHSIIVSQVPNSVHWKRENINHYVNEDAEVRSKATSVEEDDGVVVLMAHEFVSLAVQSSICDYTRKTLKNLNKKSLSLIVFGLATYMKEQSKKDKRRFREQVSGETSTRSKKGSAPVVQEDIDFSSADIELLKVKLVLETDCSLWPVETAEELGKILARFTKAVAERPFKEERLEQTFDFYAADVSGNIKVNKDGHGLQRLWQQQLMQFPLVALETAQAIASKYQSPRALIQAYKSCNNDKEASVLLQDIPIRRHAGPLSTSRKVGPELSKRIHKFLMSKDGSAIL